VRIDDEAVPTRRRLTPEQRRDELMDVGATIFGECAYEDVAMEDVAHRAHASRALVYHYFPTKRDFFAAIWKRAHDRLSAEMSDGDALSVRDEIAGALEAHLSFYEAHIPLVIIANRSSIATDPVLRAPIAEGMRTLCERILDAGGATGRSRDIASAALAGWIAFVREMTVEWLLHQRISRSDVVDACMGVLDAAVGAHLGFAAPTE
jgi:AcrR family transcriptional regulator